jgi:hypothetical protein
MNTAQRVIAFVTVCVVIAALVMAIRYGLAANRLRNPSRVPSRLGAFFIPPRLPQDYIGVGWRLQVRQFWALLFALAAIAAGAFAMRLVG